ncbi:MAG: hypothetical protein DHS20C21_06950 [Gemmatimonadota bacterium]|nr:MAG: hypothetical protein DHS20C21_06950 [Gemmatimonadota bacterium]
MKTTHVGELINAVRAQKSWNLWFRGHAQDDWELKPSVLRGYTRAQERQLGVLFRMKAPARRGSCPALEDTGAWLTLMQHYRLPTRLLDWSQSPLVAAWFACETHREQDAVVWALDPYMMNEVVLGESYLRHIGDSRLEAAVKAPLFPSVTPSPDYAAILTEETDPRMLAQSARFTLHGTDAALEQHSSAEKFLWRFIIPRGAKRSFMGDLHQLGVSKESLFPDLQHLSESIVAEVKGWDS